MSPSVLNTRHPIDSIEGGQLRFFDLLKLYGCQTLNPDWDTTTPYISTIKIHFSRNLDVQMCKMLKSFNNWKGPLTNNATYQYISMLIIKYILCFFMALLSFWHDPAVISCSKASIYPLISACSYDYLLSSVFCAAQAWPGCCPDLSGCPGWAVRTLVPWCCPVQPGPALPCLAASAWLDTRIWLTALAGKMVDICLLAHPPTNTFRDKKYP